ncbi:tRNAHis guanylyltransferase [Hesseltinella vesiculosa]|uniref:tRNA(His) guanylyltransferase n=1 Tax=Hesseltinella vesiculosa TaxID=101127 RepID=A0A1X2GTE0_9FUNG|nr:tRNAHis guanylyltransferase [Hesseltinella vesiculosa]
MANSKYEYVRHFETDDSLLPNTWIIIRIDGKGFHKFSQSHKFNKPNDRRAIDLMNHCAKAVMKELHDIMLAYGQSDEFSFVFPKWSNLYSRRASKLVSTVVSIFTANYVLAWPQFFENVCLAYAPSFDSRAVCYPSDQNLRDYLAWRQADCHINNLYNTTFWSLVLNGGKSEQEAEKALCGSFSKDKHEILFSDFQINYNNVEAIYRKGSTVIRLPQEVTYVSAKTKELGTRIKKIPTAVFEDIISPEFWDKYQLLLPDTKGK